MSACRVPPPPVYSSGAPVALKEDESGAESVRVRVREGPTHPQQRPDSPCQEALRSALTTGRLGQTARGWPAHRCRRPRAGGLQPRALSPRR